MKFDNPKTIICKHCNKEIVIAGYKKNLFCSKLCNREFKKKETKARKTEKFLNGELRYREFIYHYLVEHNGNKCSICNITEWQNKFIRLWVDHIDGDPSNNKPENFRLICPNCESQTDTSRGKNYGNGRKSKGLPCYG